MKSGFWRTDWFLGVVVVLAFAVFSRASDLIPSLERKAYDLGVSATDRQPSDRIAVIAIDDASLANIGRWPWSREVLAGMTEKLAGAKAKVIGNTVLFSEPQIDPGYVYITKLLAMAQATEGSPFLDVLKEAEAKLNTDRKLAESFATAGSVLQPMIFTLGEALGRPDAPLPDYATRNSLKQASGSDSPLPARSVMLPIEPIARAAAGLGHLNQVRDVDGAVRTEALAVRYYDEFYPSLALMIAARYLNLGPADIRLSLGEGIQLQNLRIGTDPHLLMYTYFYRGGGGREAFPVDSFFDVYSGKIPLEKYRDRIVLIGSTAAGLGDAPATPISAAMPPVLTLAHNVSSILQEHFFVTPVWAYTAELGVVLFIAIYIIVVLPRLQAGPALVISGAMFASLIVAHFGLMVGAGMWLQLMLPATLATGAAFPAGVRAYRERVSEDEPLPAVSGKLYFANTVGSAFGTLAWAFFLLPDFGVIGGIRLAAGTALVAALMVIVTPCAEASKARWRKVQVATGGGAALAVALAWFIPTPDQKALNAGVFTTIRSAKNQYAWLAQPLHPKAELLFWKDGINTSVAVVSIAATSEPASGSEQP